MDCDLGLVMCVMPPRPAGPTSRSRSVGLNVSWGHRSPPNSPFAVRLVGDGVSIQEASGSGLEAGEGLVKEDLAVARGGRRR